MSSESPKKPASSWPFFLFGLVLLVLFLIGSKLLISMQGPLPAEDAARSAERVKAYQTLQTENQQKLNTYAWVDAGKGSVQMPIAAAIKIAAARLANQAPAPAGPVNPPPPADPVTPVNEVTPVSPATPVEPTPAPAPSTPTP